MTIKQPRNANIITRANQFNQQWPRYFQQVESEINTAKNKRIRNWGAWEAQTTGFGAAAAADTRNKVPVMDFDDTNFEQVAFYGCMLESYVTGTGIDFEVHFSMTSANSGSVHWAVRFAVVSDITSITSPTNTGSAIAVPTTNGEITSLVLSKTGAGLDGVVAGDLFQVTLTREASFGSDTATGDAELIMLQARIQ